MPQIEAYVLCEEPSGKRSVVYEPGHYDYEAAVKVAKRASENDVRPGVVYRVVRTTPDVYSTPDV